MWKKLLAMFIALMGVFTVGYAYYNHQMVAAGSSYQVSASATAKLGEKGVYPNGSTGSMNKGDKVYVGTNTANGDPMSFILLANETYNTYQPVIDSSGVYSLDTSVPNVTGWFSMANEVYSRPQYFNAFPQNLTLIGGYQVVEKNLVSPAVSNIASVLNNVNANTTAKTKSILLSRNLACLQYLYNQKSRSPGIVAQVEEHISYANLNPKSFFIGDRYTLSNDKGTPSLSIAYSYAFGGKDLVFSDNYFVGEVLSVSSSTNLRVFHWNGSSNLTATYDLVDCNPSSCSTSTQYGLRLSAELDLSNVVFATGMGSGSAFSKVKNSNPTLGSYSNIYTATQDYDKLKLRLLDTSGNHAISFTDIKNGKKDSVSKVSQNSTVYLDANATEGSANGEVNTVSALFFKDNVLAYYVPIETASGSKSYELDLTGFDVGRYQIALVNESYNENDMGPADCSALTAFKNLEIVAPLSDLTFTQQSGLQVSNNVNNGDTVGVISSQNGIMPITYSLTADPAYPNEYQHLALKSDGKTVMVSGNPLHAGTYHFKIQAIDTNGDPNPPLEANASFTVDKTNLSVAFDNPNQTKKSIAEATIGWNETATANPTTDTLVTYAKSSGSVALINMDPDTGKITYAGSGGYGKVIIKATADDDPNSGYDDYNPSDTTKEIVIYREVDGTITPHTNSSSTTSPSFQTNDPNIKPNGIIGHITGILGTPDDGASGNTTYTYGLKNVDDYNFFSVNPTTGEIKTTADLSTTTGEYDITVTVSDKWSTKEIAVKINVGLAPAEDLRFYETSAAILMITSKSVVSTDTGVTVFATVKNSGNTNPVTYKIKDGSSDVIEVHPTSGAITIHGVGTKTIVAEKAGGSGQANATAELTFTVTAGEQNFIYTDASQNKLPQTGNRYNDYKETYAPNKTFRLYTDGNPPGSTVTYQLKAGSPNDVITVDPNGLVHILNASMNTQIGKVIVEATSHDPSGNYSDKTIELPITIERGTRTIAFADDPIYVISGSGNVVPNILVDGNLDTDNNTTIEVDSSQNSIAWTNDGVTIQYNWNDAQGKDVKLHVTKPADRNYKASEADGTLHILGADENVLTLSTPGKIIYGDHFAIKSTQDDSMSTNVQYTFETDNQVFISVPQVNGNKAEFDALGYSGSTTINVKVTRTADGELPLTKTVQIKVLPKPITIQIDDKEKKRLEENPPLTFQDFTSQLVSWNGVKDTIDTSHIKLSTTAKKYSPIGSYPITSGNAEKQLNDNYPNYTFTIKQGLLNVVDNGNKDFTDIDDDGCPDINIKITDDDGNEIMINGDINDDGIPDYNIDTNGDGKPDLNIDTDKDDKPDLNLVILKEWKPTKCVTLGDIQFASGISAKAEINIDLDGDLVPDINIDNKGDFKPHLNISKDGKTPSVNITIIHDWKPGKDYKIGKLQYDSIGDEIKPELNIDTDDDGRPDINLDLDDDGKPDINIDWDGDLIPDTQIDTTGDGKADTNIDLDGNGVPDENIVDITEWKPEHNVDKPFAYDTMKIESKTELEDNGIKIENPDGTPFPPSMALKVTDVTTDQKAEVTEKAAGHIGEKQEVKQVFEVKLLQNGKEVQPDGMLKIRIPIAEGYKNAILVRKNETGEYEKIDATLEDGYLVYESDTLGIVSIIADIENEVLGSYYPGANMGGALTGDSTDIPGVVGIGCLSLAIILFTLYKQKQERIQN